jgi:GxxExxY protein
MIMDFSLTKEKINKVSYQIIGAAIEVHKELGPGLLESIYQKCMSYELKRRGLLYVTESIIPLHYKGSSFDSNLRCDFYVENCLIVELKAVKEFEPIFDAQLLTYMKLMRAPKGILLNFNCLNIFSNGQKTFVNEYFSELS